MTGMFTELGERVSRTACSQFAAYQRDDPQAVVSVSVSLSLAQIATPRFPQHLIDLRRGFSISLWRLSVEIAESPLLDSSLVLVALVSLRAWGIEIAPDNFDTRHSSLERLERLPIKMVKTGPSVLAGLTERPRQAAVIDAVVG